MTRRPTVRPIGVALCGLSVPGVRCRVAGMATTPAGPNTTHHVASEQRKRVMRGSTVATTLLVATATNDLGG